MHDPHFHHWQAVKRLLRYFARTVDHGLMFHQNSSSFIIAFSDADWGADVDDKKSTTGYCVNLFSWSSHRQKTVSCSSTGAEYRVIVVVMTEILWLKSLLHELCIPTLLQRFSLKILVLFYVVSILLCTPNQNILSLTYTLLEITFNNNISLFYIYLLAIKWSILSLNQSLVPVS